MVCYKNILLSVQNHKQLISGFNPKKIGYVLPNGDINFSNEKTAIEYAKNKILQQIKNDNTEYGVLVKGQRIIGEAKGTKNSVNIADMDKFTERFWNNSNLKRDVKFFHGHPDVYSPKKTLPLSGYEGDIETAVAAKLKSIVAYNSCGEFNRIDFLNNFSLKRFKELNTKLEELFIEKVTSADDLKKLNELKKLQNTQTEIPNTIQKWFNQFIAKQEIKTEKFLKSEEYAKFMHEFYKTYMPECGLKYSTNFNNLI